MDLIFRTYPHSFLDIGGGHLVGQVHDELGELLHVDDVLATKKSIIKYYSVAVKLIFVTLGSSLSLLMILVQRAT